MRILFCGFCRAEVNERRHGSGNLERHLQGWHNISVKEELERAVRIAREKEDEAEKGTDEMGRIWGLMDEEAGMTEDVEEEGDPDHS